MARLLMVITGSDYFTFTDGTTKPTGFWAEEVVVPHELFRSAGIEVDIATPGGVEPPLDQGSMAPEMNEGGPQAIEHYREYLASIEDMRHPLVLEDLTNEQIEGYDAIFLPGGHGPMEDLAYSEALGRVLKTAQVRNKLIVAVCHGPAGLLTATEESGNWTFNGYEVTGFTNQEEEAVGLATKAPFLLETKIRELGGQFKVGNPWMSHVVIDRNLITGQNPASSAGVAQSTLERLGASLSV